MTLRLKSGETIIFATHNEGKLEELRALLSRSSVTAVSAGNFDLPEPEETGDSFIGNALIKAHAAAHIAKLPALADDSGLCVEALGGEPGIYSARWASEKKDFTKAMARVESELKKRGFEKNARACFICMLALVLPNGNEQVFEGRVDGTLTFPPRGEGGFGYDPIFVPDGETLAFGEMTAAQKQRFSHRARAFEAFAQACLPQEAVA